MYFAVISSDWNVFEKAQLLGIKNYWIEAYAIIETSSN